LRFIFDSSSHFFVTNLAIALKTLRLLLYILVVIKSSTYYAKATEYVKGIFQHTFDSAIDDE
jgi:hypothetical protein